MNVPALAETPFKRIKVVATLAIVGLAIAILVVLSQTHRTNGSTTIKFAPAAGVEVTTTVTDPPTTAAPATTVPDTTPISDAPQQTTVPVSVAPQQESPTPPTTVSFCSLSPSGCA